MSFDCERHAFSTPPSLFSLLLYFFFIVGLILSSCSGETNTPAPNNEEVLRISSVKISNKSIEMGLKATDVALLPTVSIVFSQSISVSTLNNKVTLKQGSIEKPFTITQGADGKTITIRPNASLDKSTDYTLTVSKDLKVSIGGKTYQLSKAAIFILTTVSENASAKITALTITVGSGDIEGKK